jgi:hypothetical protein
MSAPASAIDAASLHLGHTSAWRLAAFLRDAAARFEPFLEKTPVGTGKHLKSEQNLERIISYATAVHMSSSGAFLRRPRSVSGCPGGKEGRSTGHNWDNDDSLSRREKHLILIAAFIVQERGHELEAHLKLALHNGVKLEDYEPMLALLTPFIGLPAASNAAGKMHCLTVAETERPAWCTPAAKAAKK